ncbi:hypothetical protein ILUMI_26891, partial [Ignelater luminosus]
KIDLRLKTTFDELIEGRDVIYDIYFPVQSILPKPTWIEFNNKVYCEGLPEQVRPGRGVTNMWATQNYDVSIDFRPVPVTTRTLIKTITTPPTTLNIPTTSIPSAEQCGGSSVTIQNRIAHGDTIEEGEFPWMVALTYHFQDSKYKYRCAGSLVTNRHVITAAQCVHYVNASLIPTEDLLVVLGIINFRNLENEYVIRYVQSYTAHPDYQQLKGDGDIAILTLLKSVVFETGIQPLCLWQENDDLNAIVGKRGTIAGWGVDEIIENVVEAKKIRSTYRNLDSSGPCAGYGGAGLVMNINGRWTLRGVASTALSDTTGTCDPTKYTVFADAAKFRDWIRSALT